MELFSHVHVLLLNDCVNSFSHAVFYFEYLGRGNNVVTNDVVDAIVMSFVSPHVVDSEQRSKWSLCDVGKQLTNGWV